MMVSEFVQIIELLAYFGSFSFCLAHGMMEYWNIGGKSGKKHIMVLVLVTPYFQSSIIPIFSCNLAGRSEAELSSIRRP